MVYSIHVVVSPIKCLMRKCLVFLLVHKFSRSDKIYHYFPSKFLSYMLNQITIPKMMSNSRGVDLPNGLSA